MQLKDCKIVHAIELNARAPFSAIGREVELSKETAANRIKNLENKKIIQGYNTIINIAQLGFTGYAVFTRFEGMTDKSKKDLINTLQNEQLVYWIAELGGNYDLVFGIQARTINEFNEIYSKIQNKFGKLLKDNVISIRSQVTQFPRDYLLSNKISNKKEPFFGREIKLEKLEEEDKAILNIITDDARINVVDIAGKTKIPRTTVQNKLKRLQKIGIIQGYSTLVHPEHYGYQTYQLMIMIQSNNDSVKKKIFNYCQNQKSITFLVDSVGKWNFEITCEVKDQHELQQLINDFRSKHGELIKNIEIVMTFNYFRKYKLAVL
ncbi:Lrp/AsnC family transcriptional regulator [Nanoarchaeota archaeon]